MNIETDNNDYNKAVQNMHGFIIKTFILEKYEKEDYIWITIKHM